MIKPLKIQMILDFPELKDDNLFHSSMQLVFNSNELFEEWKYLNNLSKRAEIASTLSANLHDSEDKPFIPIEWIVRNIMKFTDADINEMNKYRIISGGAGATEGGGAQMGGSQSQIEPQSQGGGAQSQGGSQSQSEPPAQGFEF